MSITPHGSIECWSVFLYQPNKVHIVTIPLAAGYRSVTTTKIDVLCPSIKKMVDVHTSQGLICKCDGALYVSAECALLAWVIKPRPVLSCLSFSGLATWLGHANKWFSSNPTSLIFLPFASDVIIKHHKIHIYGCLIILSNMYLYIKSLFYA